MPPGIIVAAGAFVIQYSSIVLAVVTLAVTTLVSALTKPLTPDLESQKRKQTLRSGISPCRVIYGEYMGGGVMVFAATSGGENRWLHMVFVHCCHRVESIDQVFFDDKPSTHPDFSNVVPLVVRFEITGGESDLNAGGTGQVTLDIDGNIFVQDYDATWNAGAIRSALFNQMNGNLPGYNIGTYNDYIPYQSEEINPMDYIKGIFVQKVIIDDANQWNFTYDFEQTIDDGVITIRDYVAAGHAETKTWFRINHHLGDDDQLADQDLVHDVGVWTEAHRLRGCAYTYVRLEYDSSGEVWQNLPQVKFKIRGKNDIDDPRDSSNGYKINWALCVRDYLMSDNGLKIKPDRIPEKEWNAAADVCDEEFRGDPKYVMNGGFTLDAQPPDILESMKTACQGQIVYSGGVWIAKPAAYDAPVKTINTDMLLDDITITPEQSKFDRANSINGSYIEPLALWSNTAYPAVKNDASIKKYGEVSNTIDLPWTIDAHIAQMLVGISLKRMEYSAGTVLKLNLSGSDIQAWDVIQLDIPEIWDKKQSFRVVGVSLSMQGVVLTCQDENAEIYVPVATQDVVIPDMDTIGDTKESILDPDKYLVPKNSGEGGSDGSIFENSLE